MGEVPGSAEEIVKTVYSYAAELMKSGLEPPKSRPGCRSRGWIPRRPAWWCATCSGRATAPAAPLGTGTCSWAPCGASAGSWSPRPPTALASGGGTYVIAWGAIAAGAIQFFLGVSQSAA